MKVYSIANLDGLTEAMVAARTVGEAAGALGVSVRDMRKLGWSRLKGPGAAIALKSPGQPFYRAILGKGSRPWRSDRAEALATAARAAVRANEY